MNEEREKVKDKKVKDTGSNMQISIQKAYIKAQKAARSQAMAKCALCGGALQCPRQACQNKRKISKPKKSTKKGLLDANKRMQEKTRCTIRQVHCSDRIMAAPSFKAEVGMRYKPIEDLALGKTNRGPCTPN
ncbi:unnamed protein product [Bursaphelenchus xylophilus]|uniref:(pine wood nematode) hypothetical protein n=1 Tax=Bursaphelenchus xylophilus TaxID=6326 RepID=A0A1I7RQC7_BURXY|nr:unnamed protein product [Bursaphelenchus xylophilus]CAG9104368.1 unnamed protein product [Bursaphelenchus xylophilus]